MRKKVLVVLVALVVLVSMTSCAKVKQKFKHVKSAMVGLSRTATLYSYSGAVIRTWKSDDMRVETPDEGDNHSKFLVEGKSVRVSGGILVIEEL